MPFALASLILMLDIRGAGVCPSPTAVEERLHALAVPSTAAETAPSGAPHDEVRLDERLDRSLEITLIDSGGIRARKVLPPSSNCAERAEMTAVALAVWEERLRSGVSLHVERLPGEVPAPPSDGPERTALPPAAEAVAGAARPIPTPSSGRWIESFGVGVLGVARGPTAGARIDVRGATAAGRWRPRLSLAALGPERLDFPPGQASWMRLFGVAGAELVLWRRAVPEHGSRAAWALAGGAGVVLGVVDVRGQAFPDNRATASFDAGAELAVRLEAGLAPWRPWLGASVLSWLRAQDAVLSGPTETRSLPRWDVALALGIDLLPNL
jgi:hypothetical protein